jgi:indole-3-glycerol phosphate synthase
MFLEKIIEHKKSELITYKNQLSMSFLKDSVKNMDLPRNFSGVLKRVAHKKNDSPNFNIIAEVKKASPSKGIIREDFHPVEIARIYETCGAVALSVLTDRKFFQGSFEFLEKIKAHTELPVLNKDFIIEPYQIYQARYFGADGILLIAAVLTDYELKSFLDLANELGMAVLVEVHTLEELDRVLLTRSPIIGINNRDLTTFKVSLETSLNLIHYIPEETIVVSESGIDSKRTLSKLYAAGFDAFLIGEALIRADNIGNKLSELLN